MKDNFCLSNKICIFTNTDDPSNHIHIRDVKEFIKRLKEELDFSHIACNEDCCASQAVRETIDKLAGEKLI